MEKITIEASELSFKSLAIVNDTVFWKSITVFVNYKCPDCGAEDKRGFWFKNYIATNPDLLKIIKDDIIDSKQLRLMPHNFTCAYCFHEYNTPYEVLLRTVRKIEYL